VICLPTKPFWPQVNTAFRHVTTHSDMKRDVLGEKITILLSFKFFRVYSETCRNRRVYSLKLDIYRVLILSDKYRLSFPIFIPPCVWEIAVADCVNTVNVQRSRDTWYVTTNNKTSYL
jgi:hypothetical protein